MSLASDTPPDDALCAEVGRFIEEMTSAGILLATGGLEPGGIRVTSAGDEITVVDGPFAEAKEAVADLRPGRGLLERAGDRAGPPAPQDRR